MAFLGGAEFYNVGAEGVTGLLGSSRLPQRSQKAVVTSSSVLGVKFDKGLVMAADDLASYGSLARFRGCPRLFKVNKNTLIGGGGDYADFQYVKDAIAQKVIDDECFDDGFQMKPKALYNWLTRLLYKRRTQLNPLQNNFVIGGMQDGHPFLGCVDMLGTAFEEEQVTTGFGAYLAVPLMRNAMAAAAPQGGLAEDKAIALLENCLRVLYYRDARSWPTYHLAVVTKDKVDIQGPLTVETIDANWEYANHFQGYI